MLRMSSVTQTLIVIVVMLMVLMILLLIRCAGWPLSRVCVCVPSCCKFRSSETSPLLGLRSNMACKPSAPAIFWWSFVTLQLGLGAL